MKLSERIQHKLSERKKENAFRQLRSISDTTIDFCSNDYLGIARSQIVANNILKTLQKQTTVQSGASGSRLISGNNQFVETLEQKIAIHHQSESALLFPSGYQANIGLLSCIPARNDIILYDELCHTSLKDGMRLSHAKKISFKHNDISDLKNKLQQKAEQKFIVIESLYSMDGDFASIEEISQIATYYEAHLIVDEAHTGGVYGKQGAGFVSEKGLKDFVFARIITYGKAFGVQGAAILCNKQIKDYLINFSRPFIYTTGISPLLAVGIDQTYDYIIAHPELATKLHENIQYFCNCSATYIPNLQTNKSAIQKYIIPGNVEIKKVSKALQECGFDVVPILSPTVPNGSERIRIVLHSYNKKSEIENFLITIKNIL
jgi:8-amino-7-oxononanoate synthase